MKGSENHRNCHINTASTVVHFAPDEIIATSHQVCRYAGGANYKIDGDSAKLVSKTLQAARGFITPALVYAIHPVSEGLADGTLILQNRISLVLPPHERGGHTRYVAAAICTLGEALETACRKLDQQGDFLQSLFLNACGVALTEALAEKAYELISQKAETKNLYAGCRFAPGYTGMPMSDQALLFKLVDGPAIGVTLNTHLVMNPGKSLSFLIRLTDRKAPLSGIYKCERCPVSDCVFRVRPAKALRQQYTARTPAESGMNSFKQCLRRIPQRPGRNMEIILCCEHLR